MTSIRETVVSALTNAGVSSYQQNNYSTYIDAVVNAVEAQQGETAPQVDAGEQGYVIIENLVALAKERGLGLGSYEEELISAIEQATGLTRRPAPEPEPAVDELEGMLEGEAGTDQKLDAILATLNSIATKQAEQDTALEALKGLAKSRLGVTI